MALQIRLIGAPAIERDGSPVRLPGRKTWALLAMLAIDPRPISRHELVGRLTSEADDPQAALRWLLHAVRRALAPDAQIVEDVGRLRLDGRPDTQIDVRRLQALEADQVDLVSLLGGELLEGMHFDDAPGVAFWLTMERARIRGAAAEALWYAASRIAGSDPEEAFRLVRHGLAIDPYCETKHELIIDLHLQQGDVRSARAHAEAARRLFRHELGVDVPDTILRPLVRRSVNASVAPGPSTRALLQAAEARLAAGDAERATETARRAADEALRADDQPLELVSLLLLSRILIHGHRGRRMEAKGLLTRCAQIAASLGDRSAQSDVEREMGFLCMLEGSYGIADPLLARSGANAAALGDPGREGQAATYRGISRSDQCDFEMAAGLFTAAIERFSALNEPGWQGFAEAMSARTLLRSGEAATAYRLARQARERVRIGGWTAVLPWPLLVEAECLLWNGTVAPGSAMTAEELFSEALELSTEIGDAALEGLAWRGLALTRIAIGDRSGAEERLRRALTTARRFSDTYAWAEAVILADLVELEEGRDPGHLADAVRLATEGPMPDLAARMSAWRPLPNAQTLQQTASA